MNKLKTLKKELNHLKKQTLFLSNKIKQEENRLAKKQLKTYRKEINSGYLKNLTQLSQEMYNKLCRLDFPENGICTHFGVSRKINSDFLSFSIKDSNLLITLYRGEKQYLENKKKVGYSVTQHEKRINAILKALNTECVDVWNNNEDSSGFSMVVKLKVPLALKTATENYHKLNNVFTLTKEDEKYFKEFEFWWDKQ